MVGNKDQIVNDQINSWIFFFYLLVMNCNNLRIIEQLM